MEIQIIKVKEADKDKWWVKQGNFMIVPKSKILENPLDYSFKFKVLFTFDVPEGMFTGYHYSDSLRGLIRRQESAVKMAKTSYKRIPIRNKLIAELKALLPK